MSRQAGRISSMLAAADARCGGLRTEVPVAILISALLVPVTFWTAEPAWLFAGGAMLLSLLLPGSGLIALALVLFVLPPLRAGGIVADIRADEILAIATIAGFVVRAPRHNGISDLRVVRVGIALLVVSMMWIGFRFALGTYAADVSSLFPSVKYASRFLLLTTTAWLAWQMPERRGALRTALLVGGVLAAALSIMQYYSPSVERFILEHYPSARGGQARLYFYGRTFGPFEGNPNHLGAAMLLLSIMSFMSVMRDGRRWVRAAGFAAGVLFLVAMIHSGSRGAFIVLLVLTVGYAVRRHREAFLGSAVAVIYMLLTPNALRARLPFLLLSDGGSLILGTSATGKVAMLDPGYTSSVSGIIVPVDSTYLDMLYNYGPIALLLFLAIVWLVTRWVWRGSLRRDGMATAALWVIGMMVLISANGPFFSVPRVAEAAWLIVGLGLASTASGDPSPGVRRRVAICSSVHMQWDARVTYREAVAMCSEFDVSMYLHAHREEPADSDMPVGIVMHTLPRPRNRLLRMLGAGRLVQRALADGAQVVVVHDPELLPWLAVLTVGRDVVSVYDVHEDYASMVRAKPWLPSWSRRPVSWLVEHIERALVRSVDVVLVADAYLESRFIAYGCHPVLVRNHPPVELFESPMPAGSRQPTIVYVGGLTRERGTSIMASLMRRVRAAVPDARMLVIGRVPHGDAETLLSDVEGLELRGEVAYDRIGPMIGNARVGLALLQDTEKHRRNVPSKLFDYMAAGTPFVASCFPNIEAATGGKGGLFVDPSDLEAAADAVVRLLTDDDLATDLGYAGREAIEEGGGFACEAERLIERIRLAINRTV